MLAAPSSRSRIYLDVLERRGLFPETVVLLTDPTIETAEQRRRNELGDVPDAPLPEDPQLDPTRTVEQRIEDNGLTSHKLATLDPNDSEVVDVISGLEQELLIYSGPGGAILSGELLAAGPEFLHVHAGTLPEYRGSTTVYYSLLEEGTCGATAFIMNENIDEGPIVASGTYPAPQDPTTLDLYYDPWIRAKLLTDAVDTYQLEGSFSGRPQNTDSGETYFVIHPVLKHLAILRAEQ